MDNTTISTETQYIPKTTIYFDKVTVEEGSAFEDIHEAENKETSIKEYRTAQVQDTMYVDGNKKINEGTTILGVDLGASIVGGICLKTIAALSGPIGWAILGTCALGGAIWGISKINQGNKAQEQADLLNCPAGKTDSLGHNDGNIVASSIDKVFGDNVVVQDAEYLEQSANNTKFDNNSTSQRNIYVISQSNIKDAGERQLIVTDCTIDSKKYNGKKDSNDNEIGYEQKEYSINGYYSNLLEKYASSFENTLDNNQADRFIELTSALESNATKQEDENSRKVEDNDFFDFNNDGYINLTDLAGLNYYIIHNSSCEGIENVVTDSYKAVKENFGDNISVEYMADKDLSGFNSEKLDINADGKIDNKDSELIKEYLKSRTTIADKYDKMYEKIKDGFGGETEYKAAYNLLQ